MIADELRFAEKRYRKAEIRAETLRCERNACIQRAIAEGMTHAQIAEATGLTRGRVGQISLMMQGAAA